MLTPQQSNQSFFAQDPSTIALERPLFADGASRHYRLTLLLHLHVGGFRGMTGIEEVSFSMCL